MGYLGDPWILAAHQGLVDQETLSDQVVQRVQSLLSGQGHHQTQGHLEVQASPLSLSHLQEREKICYLVWWAASWLRSYFSSPGSKHRV